MKTVNGSTQMMDIEVGPTDALHALHAELVRLEVLAKHHCLTEVELLVGAAAQAASEVLNRGHPALN